MRTRLTAEKTVLDYSRRHGKHIYQATLGTPAGTVVHPAGTGWVYAQLHGDQNQVVRAYNAGKVPETAGLVIDLELVEREAASTYEVLGVSTNIIYVNNGWSNSVAAHADQHQRRDLGAGGYDPLDIYTRALVNLRARAQATPDMTVYIERGFYFINGVLAEWTGGNSGAFTAPAGSPPVVVRRCDFVYMGPDYAPHIVTGTTTVDGSLPPYPTPPAPYVPVAYVYLSNTSTTITENIMKDARVILTASNAVGTAHNLLSATHGDTLTGSVVDGDVVIGNATPKWSRLAIAIPAANVRNVLGIDNGELRPSWKTALDSTSPATLSAVAAASAGTSLVFAHRDHVHALAGIHHSTSITYISGTGTAGADNTAQTVKTLTLAANTLTQVGDRMRIRAYWTGDNGSPVTGSCKVGPSGSEVLVSHTTDAGAATLQLNEVWLHYIDNTHSNIIENEAGALGALSAPNVAGFTWNASQDIIFTQDAIANNHTILYALIVDVFPKGV